MTAQEVKDKIYKLLETKDWNNNEKAMFIAQCDHETGGFTKFSEGLNYSAERLNVVFPKYFKNANVSAEGYHRQPQKIANRVYANRMGNGDEASGDGYKYRGRGLIQLTGKNNYAMASKRTGLDLLDNPDQVATDPEVSVQASLAWWENAKETDKRFKPAVENGDVVTATKVINGGTNGLAHREELFKKYLPTFS